MPMDWPYAWLAPLVAAPFAGSFLGVLIRRLPSGRAVALARSACESCNTPLAAIDMIPLASFLAQRGRCRRCGARIAPMHLAVELAAFGVALWAACVLPDAGAIWLGCLLGWTLLAAGWIDWEHMILPDMLTLPLVVAGLAATWLLEPEALAAHAIAAIAGYVSFRALAIVYRALRGRDGLGEGDAKLLAAAGAWTGAALPLVVFVAALAGLCLALAGAVRGQRIGAATAVPFGPPLALALWLVWLYAPA
jgi:leader peptidase (prepilin peptidase)/N-methyltransferase